MRIWIDLSNSPHPLLFAPIARRLEELGHKVGVTARDNAQTVELTRKRWPDATIIGDESPKSRLHKAEVLMARIPKLRRWARGFRPDVALSHNSYAQIVAARMLRLPVVTAMDYEGQPANHLAFRLAHIILLPEALRGSGAWKQGATNGRTRFYPGFKEEIALGDFEPNPGVLELLNIEPGGMTLVVARTPPSRAAYHQFGNRLFGEVLRALGNERNVCTVVLPRHSGEREAIDALGSSRIVVPNHAIDSRSLMYEADLVIGAGGTMTREAALMGVPTFSVFAGPPAAVDRSLEAEGRLSKLYSVAQLRGLRPRTKLPFSSKQLKANATPIETVFLRTVTSIKP